ncbi:MAG: hypothetical protein RMX96_21780 [Nostoc sp. ChiSLP02]|nr:hypothetical protein [Nostoc sp. DedSLP05]MDZ8097269.1 hypothetical protein [Nostoc sp. DedSLP01]MDZ8187465.1 hypothetical protein [Nostoc sp. ChiSLP02]
MKKDTRCSGLKGQHLVSYDDWRSQNILKSHILTGCSKNAGVTIQSKLSSES